MARKTKEETKVTTTQETTELKEPKKRGRKPKVVEAIEGIVAEVVKPKRGRKPKATQATEDEETKVEEVVEVIEEEEVIERDPVEIQANIDQQLESVNTLYDPEKTQMDLDGLSSLSKDVKKSMAFVSDEQIRLIIDNYYATQKHRMNIANQIRAVQQGFDKVQEGEQPAIAWLLKDVENRENQIKKMIAEYVKKEPVCQWLMDIKGIGPVFAANLWSYIDMSKCFHANQFVSYAGLNDNNTPWLGKVKAEEIVNEAYNHFGLKPNDKADDDVFLRVAVNSGRNVPAVKRGFQNHKDNAKTKVSDKTALINFLAKPPYNIELKKMCYLIGESFVKVSGRGSLYGRLYLERKAWETMQNENLAYKDQAEALLNEKNYSKEKDTYKYLSQGKLSPAHIHRRACRHATKIFLTHFFEACWIYTYGTKPPVIYPIAHQGHVDYIEPEVPYEKYLEIKK